jgi:Pvc16 N-terminal domain
VSNFLAIGGVSATLQRLLKDRMPQELEPLGINFQVTVSSPRSDQQNGQEMEEPRINLFLYRVTENGALKNQEIPGEGHPSAYGRPPLSLNLHYLLTPFGTTAEEEQFVNESRAQQLLGSAMRIFHDHPIITAQLLTIEPPAGLPILDESLRDQFEQVKLTLDPLTLEDLSKVWTALTLPYKLSAAYIVSVVQIDSRRQRRLALPVTLRRLHVAPLRRPQITALYRTPANPGDPTGDLRVKIGDPITIEGFNFTAPITWVKLADLDPQLVTANDPLFHLVSDVKIELTVPDDVVLQPGPQIVQVLTQLATEVVQGGLDKGEVVLDQSVQNSNQTVFMLVPQINSISSTADLLTVNGIRLFREGLKSYVLIGDFAIEVRPSTAEDPVAWAPPTATSVQVPLAPLATAEPPLAPGPQRVRVRVNGAETTEENFQFTI